MALKNGVSRGQFINVSKGKFILRNGDGTKTEYDTISGVISKITFEDDEYEGKKLRKIVFQIRDGDEQYTLKIDASNGYARQVIMKLPNCDIAQPIEISLTYDPKTKKAGAFVNQNGVSIKQKWTQAEPGDMPRVKEVKVKGQVVYDGEEQNAWLEKYVTENIAPLCVGAKATSSSQDTDEPDDSIPF